MEQRDYSKDLPLEPPEGLLPWLKSKGKFGNHMIRYKASRVLDPLTDQWEKAVELRCSGCGQTMYAARVEAEGCHNSCAPAPFGYLDPVTKHAVISGNKVHCPMCECPAEAVHVTNCRYGKTLESEWPMTVERLEDKLVLIGWYVSQYVDRDNVETISVRPYEAYVVEQKKVIRLMGYMKCMSSISFFGHWEQRKTCLDNWGLAPVVYPWNPAILEGSTAENSKLDLYMKQAKEKYPVTYLRVWQRHRNIENLVVQGCGFLVGELIRSESHRYSYQRARGVPKLEEIRWKEVRPSKMLGLDKEAFQFCRDMKWELTTLIFYRNCMENGVKLRLPEDLKDCIDAKTWWCNRILEEGLPMMRCVRYLKKQKVLDKRVDSNILDDYWRIARREGYDLEDDHVRFPKNLMREHDRLVQEQRLREEAKRRKEREEQNRKLKEGFKKRTKELKCFNWTRGSLLIRLCEAPEELDQEGKALNHCVASYKNSHAEGQRVIFFIRKVKEQDKPYFTLELNVKDLLVVQNRGKCNCSRTKQVEEFETAWLEHIRALGKEKKKRGNVA